jgi:hypothetical protein
VMPAVVARRAPLGDGAIRAAVELEIMVEF